MDETMKEDSKSWGWGEWRTKTNRTTRFAKVKPKIGQEANINLYPEKIIVSNIAKQKLI